jgi:regulator of sirC expression with transglutaminase-like and TPR domain
MKADAAAVERFKHCVGLGEPGLVEAVSLLALHHYPAVSAVDTVAALDQLALTVPDASRKALVETLFGPGQFAGNTDAYYDPDNSFLHRVLERRLGIPISLALVGIEVGRRIGVPLHGVGYPGHFLLRDASEPTVFIDPFGGRILSEADCVVWFHQSHPAGTAWHRDYLQPVDHVFILSRMISNLVATFERTRDYGGIQWLMTLRCALPNATAADRQAFARLLAPLN